MIRAVDKAREARAPRCRRQTGASFLIALVLFLICALVAAVAISASSVNVERAAQKAENQAYLAVVSSLDSASTLVGADDAVAKLVMRRPSEGAQVVVEQAGTDRLGLAQWASEQAINISAGNAATPKRVKVHPSGLAGAAAPDTLVIFEMDKDYNIYATACEFVPKWAAGSVPASIEAIRADLVAEAAYAKTMGRYVATVQYSAVNAPYNMTWAINSPFAEGGA